MVPVLVMQDITIIMEHVTSAISHATDAKDQARVIVLNVQILQLILEKI